jgi:hypothetical protein
MFICSNVNDLAEVKTVLVKRVWIEPEPEIGFDPISDSADVLVEMEDERLWQAHFVTLPHLQQEMRLSQDVAQQHHRALAITQFLALETPHVIVEKLTADIIEDVIDNLMALGVFESVFLKFDETDGDPPAM